MHYTQRLYQKILCVHLERLERLWKSVGTSKALAICVQHASDRSSTVDGGSGRCYFPKLQLNFLLLLLSSSLMMKRAVWKEQRWERVSQHCNHYSNISPLLIKIMSHSSSFRLNLLPGKPANYCHYSSVRRSSDHT